MRKIRSFIIASVVLFFSAELFAQSLAPSGFQFGPYVEYNMGLGSITEHEVGNVAVGADVYYQLPLNLPDFIPLSNLGVSGSVDFGTAVGKKDYVDSWNVCNVTFGVWFEWNFFSFIRLRPEASYGVAMNFVESKARNVSGLHADQLIKLGGTLIFEPVSMRGFAVYGGVDYKFMPEKENIGNFLGFKVGLLYRPENTYRKTKAAEKVIAQQEAQTNADAE